MKLTKLVTILVLALMFAVALPAEAQQRRNKSKGKARSAAKTVAAPAVPANAAKSPQVKISHTVFNAGNLKPGEKISHDFVITNTGGQDLKILKVVSGCGCTVTSYDQVIAPGKSGKVNFTVNLYSDWAGRRINQSALVETNDPVHPYLSLTVSANVVKS